MATNFPGSLDGGSNVGDGSHPTADEPLTNAPTHSLLHQSLGLAVTAIETKLGVDATTANPSSDTVLTGTSASNSQWQQVQTAMIGNDQVTQAKIADDAVGADQLASNAVVTASIVNDNVTQAKIAAGAVDTTELAADAVTGAKIEDDAVNSEHIAAGAIDTEHIADDQVTQAKIGVGAVGSTEIATGAVGNDELVDAPTFTTVTATNITLGGQDLGEIVAFTPTWTNASNLESNQGYYAYVKDMVFISIEAELSGTSTIGDTRVDLPVAGSDTYQASNAMLQVQLFDSDTNTFYQGMATPVDPNTIQVRRVAVSGSNLIGGPTSADLPFTWADGDKILITGFYRVGS